MATLVGAPSMGKLDLDFDYYMGLNESAIMSALGTFIGVGEPKWAPRALFQARAELPIDAQDAPKHVNNPLFDEVGGDKEAAWVVDLDPVWSRITRVTSREDASPRDGPSTERSGSSAPADEPSSPSSSPRSAASLYDAWYRDGDRPRTEPRVERERRPAALPGSPLGRGNIFGQDGEVNWAAFVEVD